MAVILNEFGLALFIMFVGLSAAGAGTHLYQHVWQAPARLTYAGRNYVATLGHLAVSFFCGPYIMLGLGLTRDVNSGQISLPNAFLASLVAFGWAFLTGLLLMGAYIAIAG